MRHGASPVPLDPETKVGWSPTATHDAVPLNGLRYKPVGDTSGWYIWGGEDLPSDPDFFKPLHAHHLEQRCPTVVPFLALPPGWRFLLAPGQIDVWYDETLLEDDEDAV